MTVVIRYELRKCLDFQIFLKHFFRQNNFHSKGHDKDSMMQFMTGNIDNIKGKLQSLLAFNCHNFMVLKFHLLFPHPKLTQIYFCQA